MVSQTGQALRILLVEDSVSDRLLIEQQLRDPRPLTRPVALTSVGDAAAALDAVRQAAFSLILIDYRLPGRNGLELLSDLRAAALETPVILITGCADERVALTSLQCGASDYVIKQLGFERALPVVIEKVLGTNAFAE